MAKKKGKKGSFARARKSMEKRGTVGSFTRWCKSQGYGGVTGECVRQGLNSRSKAIRKKAQFAKGARTTARRRKK